MTRECHDVLLSCNRRDQAAVLELAEALRQRGIRPWLDLWDLIPGRSWQEELEAVIETVPAAAVCVGRDGLGPWEARETRACLEEYVRRRLPVVPVLLPGAPENPELPLFLRAFTWVDLRGGLTDAGIDRLVWGITGEKPEPAYPDAETRELSLALNEAQRRKGLLEGDGHDTAAVIGEIVDLKRRLREGARLRAGDVLDGRFELLEAVGRGGFAQVWKAYDLGRRATVAVKVLHPQYAEDKTRRKRFFRGARNMAKLRHPGIVEVVEEQAEDGGFHFFVMEYVAGGDFRQAVLAGRLPLGERIRVVLEVGEALGYAHERGIVHRDVKPANVLLGLDGRPKLTDFDLVRAADSTGGTRTSSMLGTFLYAAPEAMLDASEAGFPADVFGLGMTALFALHGAELPPVVLRKLPEFLASVDVPETWRPVLERAVEWEVEDRWDTIAEFCGALRMALEPAEIGISPASPNPPSGCSTTWVLRERINEKDGSMLVYVPGGEFVLGEGSSRHRVVLSPFWMGRYPVTNEQYGRFLEATHHREPSYWDDDRFNGAAQPVVGVDWEDAKAYCAWAGLDLPSEAQWEAAARGTDERRYPWGDDKPTSGRADYGKDFSADKPDEVGSHPSGAGTYGVEDQAGGVWEWCEDFWNDRAYEEREGQTDPVSATGDAAFRVVRGGSWALRARSLPAAIRLGLRVGTLHQSLGFRVMCRSGSEP